MVAIDKNKIKSNSTRLGYESSGLSTDAEPIPACSIEDVDRTVFELFKEKIPLFFIDKKGLRQQYLLKI